MKQRFLASLISGFCLFLFNIGFAQPIASFTIDRYNICSGNSAHLYNTSIGTNAYEWLIDGTHYSYSKDTSVVLIEPCYDLKEIKLIALDTVTGLYDSARTTVEVFDTCFFHWFGTFLNCPGDTIKLGFNAEEINTEFIPSAIVTVVNGCFTCPSIEFVLLSAGTTMDRISTYAGGCTEITTYEYFCTLTDINEKEESSILIFPNPVKDMVTIISYQPSPYEILITDLTGRNVHKQIMSDNESTIDLSAFQSGMYIIQVTSSTGIPKLHRIIKQ